MTLAVFSTNENAIMGSSTNGALRKGNPLQDVTNRKSALIQNPNMKVKLLTKVARPSAACSSASESSTLKSTVLNPFKNIIPMDVPMKPFCDHDIDSTDKANPLAVTEYVDTIYELLREKERNATPLPDLSDRQSSIYTNMLEVLIDWLVEVHASQSASYSPDTLYLTVNIINRFLAKVDVDRSKLQLVGVTAYFLAAKYEEIWAPGLDELVYMCDHNYSERGIVTMETVILKTLNYDMSPATSTKFLPRFCKAASADGMVNNIASWILEGTLLSNGLQKTFLPSELAAGAVLIASKAAGCPPWSVKLEHHTRYSMPHVLRVAEAILVEKFNTPAGLASVDKKYSDLSKVVRLDRVLNWCKRN